MAPPADPTHTRANPVAPAPEQSATVGLTNPTMGEPSTTGLASPSGGLHDDGDPGVEEMRDAVAMSSGLARANMELAGDMPSSAAQGSPTAAKQTSSAGASIAEAVLGHPV